jgi:SAM-dependent methyltransferase
MTEDGRALVDKALRRARRSAYGPGEFVGQEGFMRATQIRSLAVAAGVAPGVSVLDLCCGVAGPGRFITRELGCTYTGVDSSSSAIEIAREHAGDLACRFEVARVPPVLPGPFDVVILLETMLAFRDKEALLRDIAPALPVGGRFVFTMEEGRPLTAEESLIAAQIGAHAIDALLAAHRLWSEWLGGGRVRKFAVIAEKDTDPVDAVL